jgi:hypothetical protein
LDGFCRCTWAFVSFFFQCPLGVLELLPRNAQKRTKKKIVFVLGVGWTPRKLIKYTSGSPSLFFWSAPWLQRRAQLTRGRQKQIDGPPRTFAKSQTHPPTTRFFFLDLFFSTFFSVSRQGVQKHHKHIFTKKSCRKVFYKKFDQKSKTDFFSNFLSRFWTFLEGGEFKNTIKKYRKKM